MELTVQQHGTEKSAEEKAKTGKRNIVGHDEYPLMYHSSIPKEPVSSGSLPNFPMFPFDDLSATNHRHRPRNLCKRNQDILLGTSPSRVVAAIPRDQTQPTSGSISDVHTAVCTDDEEFDFFPPKPNFRPRSNTCPENRALYRKIRVRIKERPPTPPPGGADDREIESRLHKLALRDKLKIKPVPLCVLEYSNTSEYHQNHEEPGQIDN